MLKTITQISPRYYQLALLNIGLIIALSKELSFLHIVLSLVLVILIAAPLSVLLNIIDPSSVQIVHKETEEKLKILLNSFVGFWKSWNNQPEQKRMKHITIMLFGIYLSISFLCPCIESFLIINSIYVIVFMPEQTQLLMSLAQHPLFKWSQPAK